jgi:hypothetical protein
MFFSTRNISEDIRNGSTEILKPTICPKQLSTETQMAEDASQNIIHHVHDPFYRGCDLLCAEL